MIHAAVALLIIVLLAGEAVVLWLDQIHARRAEQAYWRCKDTRPEQYDWAKELDL